MIASGGAIMSPAVKDQLRELLPSTKIVDTFGASETGGQGRLSSRGGDGLRLVTDEFTAVFDDDHHVVEPWHPASSASWHVVAGFRSATTRIRRRPP